MIAETIPDQPLCNEAGTAAGSSSSNAHNVTMLSFLSWTRGSPSFDFMAANHLSKNLRVLAASVVSITCRAAEGLYNTTLIRESRTANWRPREDPSFSSANEIWTTDGMA